MCHINNSRSAVYGYDQRVELLGNKGMVISDNRKPHELRQYTVTQTESAQPYLYFFIERYHEAFIAGLDAFIDSVEQGVPCQAGFEDGRRALMLAEAAYRSLQSGAMVKVEAAG
jgi:myo-inositol 2-dehydrogenase/D-chiro-inositol 1-dehydrogenase